MKDKLTCPHCDETFTKDEAQWTVCLTCGMIEEPGEDTMVGHGPGPGSDTEIFGECCSFLNMYSEESALEKQAEVREKERETFIEVGRTPPWEE